MKCDNCSTRKDCSVYLDGERRTECKYYEPMTNEEYIRSCSTEELAKTIALIAGSNILNVWCIKYHCADSDVDAVKMWLKEVHK